MIPVSVRGSAQSSLWTNRLIAYYRQLDQATLTVIDVETTGPKPSTSRVIEIGILQGSLTGGVTYEDSFLVNPQVRVPAQITQLTGITTAMVETGVLSCDLWPNLISPLSAGVLTGHNLAFDYGFLQSEYHRMNQPFIRPDAQQFCTVILSRLLLADLPSRSLPQLVQHFGFKVGQSHRALADAKACWLLARHLLTQLQGMSDRQLRHILEQQWIPLSEAAKGFGHPPRDIQHHLEQRGCEYRSSRRSNRYLYRRGDLETVYQAVYAP
ncbi:DNA polymerase III subunit epsilon [Leptolyngbya sp. BL0902]|uniref:3'-5' exonuclease n=1 Tax=Leptolyngbya sp. BL0902 TaxID=1115757 RepID=UPI0018E7ACC6|nr:3'-5' exonuclease [Leptolyngbya sp. BL0902]QQE65787.1 DNA polymerase III subunit epsilon [Leptolyngbya sp. BL0902]